MKAYVWLLEADERARSVHLTAISAMCQQSATWKRTSEERDEWESIPRAGEALLTVKRFEMIP